MKKWLQHLSGAVVASLLALTLNGKAYANMEEQEPPAEAPTQIEQPSLATVAVAAAPVTVEAMPEVTFEAPQEVFAPPAPVESVAVPEVPVTVTETPAADHTVPAGSDITVTDPVQAIVEAPAAEISEVTSELPEASSEIPEVQEAAVTPETPRSDSTPTDPSEAVPETRPEQLPVPAEVQAAPTVTAAEIPEEETEFQPAAPAVADAPELAKTRVVTLKSTPQTIARTLSDEALSATETGLSDDTPDDSGDASDGEETDTPQAVTTVFTQNKDGSYTLVNHTGTESITAEGDITVLAAGLNHISSISGSGTVRVAGTGILLVDSLAGNLELLTLTDIYDEGSVAVFVKQNDGTYLLKNGTVPGVLDEEYKIEGVTLVMPESTSLHLIGTGALPKYDEENNLTEVIYYHGTEHEVKEEDPKDFPNTVEITGKLTICQQAKLIIQKGASILMENLKSIGDAILQPELIVTDGGKLTVEEGEILGQERENEYGTIKKDGLITISGEPGTLSGSGSITADRIVVKDPSALNTLPAENPGDPASCEITFTSDEFELEANGEEKCTVSGLRIKDSTVYVESNDITLSNLNSTGDSTVVLPNHSELGIAEVNGTLHLSQREYYNRPYGENNFAGYSDSNAQKIYGDISGSGTICLDSGIYVIPEGATVSGISFSTDFGGLLYDYAGVLTKSLQSPLHMNPTYAERAGDNKGKIPVVAVKLGEIHSIDGTKTLKVEGSVDLGSGSLTAASGTGGDWTLQLLDLKTMIQEGNPSGYSVVVEFLRKDESGILHTDFYALEDLPPNSLEASGDVCLIRVSYVKNAEPVAPAGSAAQTGTTFTGSGILGGSGAGSVNIGNAKPGDNSSNGGGSTNSDTGNKDPKPVPLVTQVAGDGQQQVLVWAEKSPVGKPGDYILKALEGEKTLRELGGKANVSMNYAPPAEYAGKPLYVVFRNADGSLTAIRATWSKITGLLRFVTDRLGSFKVVGFDFAGEEFSKEFYEALAQLSELEDLIYTDYSPV